MHLWHLTPDARRMPHRVSPGDRVTLDIGSRPIETGQSLWVTYRSEGLVPGVAEEGSVEAAWRHNEGENSYWRGDGRGDPAGRQAHHPYDLPGHAHLVERNQAVEGRR